MNEVRERLTQFINYLKISVSQFEQSIGVGNGFVANTNERMRNSSKNLIITKYPELNMEWLIRGKGNMLNPIPNTINSSGENSANAIHGNAIVINDRNGVGYSKSLYLELSELFDGATSSIRYYGKEMVEYPNGSILLLKKVENLNLLVWGRNYLIETEEFKITRRIANGGNNTILALCTNKEENSKEAHLFQDIKIPKDAIVSMSLVIGVLIKEYSDNRI